MFLVVLRWYLYFFLVFACRADSSLIGCVGVFVPSFSLNTGLCSGGILFVEAGTLDCSRI